MSYYLKCHICNEEHFVYVPDEPDEILEESLQRLDDLDIQITKLNNNIPLLKGCYRNHYHIYINNNRNVINLVVTDNPVNNLYETYLYVKGSGKCVKIYTDLFVQICSKNQYKTAQEILDEFYLLRTKIWSYHEDV